MEENIREIREFLESTEEELLKRRVLRGKTLLLQGPSVDLLLGLMREHDITRLETHRGDWWLSENGEFYNPKSDEQLKQGHVDRLKKRGNVFNEQNVAINPHYRKKYGENQDAAGSANGHSEEYTFSLEPDLQRVLRANIEQLEPRLKIIDGGTERTVGVGRIDITAEDGSGSLVVIELKAVTAEHRDVSQLLSYMGSIENPQAKPIRGVLVAPDFHPRTVSAANAVSNISLKAYSIQFTFEDR